MSDGEPIFEVASEIFDRWPGYMVGCVLLTGADNRESCTAIDRVLGDAEAEVQQTFRDTDLKNAQSFAIWRAVFSECGWTPSKHLSSIEAILKRAARGQTLPRISPIVDLANACSLIARTPIGAHDVASFMSGPLTVRFAVPDDRFMSLRDAQPETPAEGEVVYASAHSVRTRRWVWRQSTDALISPSTRDVFFPIDGFTPETSDAVSRSLDLLAGAASDFLGGTVCTGIVNAKNRAFHS